MTRIPFPDLATMSPEQRAVHDAYVASPRGRMYQGPTLMALHRPELADRVQRLGELLRYDTSFPSRLSELAILVAAREWNSAAAWCHHEPPARKGGLSDQIIEALRHHRRPENMAEDEKAVYEFSRELCNKRVSDKTYHNVLDRFGVVGTVELTALLGYYTMVVMSLTAHELPLPDGAEYPFPDTQ